jgi:hypothetical protein
MEVRPPEMLRVFLGEVRGLGPMLKASKKPV